MTALATVADLPILEGQFSFPLMGAWDFVGAVQTTSTDALVGKVSMVVGESNLEGTCAVTGIDRGDRVTVRVVGGAGGLRAPVTAQGYNNNTRQDVIQNILDAGGETLSRDADPAFLNGQLAAWVRMAGIVANALWRLAEAGGATWRTLLDGTVWFGTDTWPETPEDGTVVEDEDPTNRSLLVALEDLLVLPGATFAGQRISQAVYTLDDVRLRARLRYGDAREGVAALMGQFIEDETAHRDYEAHYAARVVGQNSDETLELRPYDERVPKLSKVPFRPGLPGLSSFQVAAGTDVVLAFEDGRPDKPVVMSWAQFTAGQLLKLAIDCADLRLGSANATAFVADATKVDAELQKLAATLATGTSPAGAVTFGNPYVPQSVAATKVRCE